MACVQALPAVPVYVVRNGRAIFIYNEKFIQGLGVSDIDFGNDIQLVKDLLRNYQITDKEHHKNRTALQMRDDMRNFAESVQPETDGLICVLLSHGKTQHTEDGDHDAIYATDDTVLLRDLMGIWNCDRLEGKPKIFIVVACRGKAWSNPVTVPLRHNVPVPPDSPASNLEELSADENPSLGPELMGNPESRERSTIPADIPVWKDCVLIYTTQPGYAAPSPVGGKPSPLLTSLVRHAAERRELMKSVTYALGDVALGFGDGNIKLMPWVASRLTKEVYFGNH